MQDWTYFLEGCNERPNRGWHGIIKYMAEKECLTKYQGVPFVDFIEQYFVWNNNAPITEKWIGVSHLTPNTPTHWSVVNSDYIFNNNNFLKSLKYCHALIFLSDYMKEDFNKKTQNLVNTLSIKHPVSSDITKFDFEKFKQANKKVILLGQQLRKISSLYKLSTQLDKEWYPGLSDISTAKRRRNADLITNGLIPYIDIDINSVKIKYTEDLNEYDRTINENIVIVDMYDASANNSILEHMSACAPFFCKRLAASEQYLGKDYPMFFNSIKEIEPIISNESQLLTLYERAHVYLKNIDKSDLTYSHFTEQVLKTIN